MKEKRPAANLLSERVRRGSGIDVTSIAMKGKWQSSNSSEIRQISAKFSRALPEVSPP